MNIHEADFWVYEVSCEKPSVSAAPYFCENELIQGVCDFEKCQYLTIVIADYDCSVLIQDNS